MKKVIIAAICLFVSTFSAMASKAISLPLTIQQSDGSYITVYLHGDADFHWYTDLEGNILERNGNDFKRIGISNEEYLAQGNAAKQQRMKKISLGTTTPAYFPHSGKPKALMILVNFTDSTFKLTDPKRSFDEYLNSETRPVRYDHREDRNMGSVATYFKDMSNGAFTPQFDVVGPVTVSQGVAAYGGNTGGESTDKNVPGLISEALKLVDDQVDFTQYDNDGDGYIDIVGIIYAGYSENVGASSNTIWPKSGYTTLGTYDGKKASRYIVSGELNFYPGYTTTPRMNGVGVFIHEFGHAMGLPDLYPTVSSARVDNQAMEYWDVMDGGEYTDNGYCPTPYTPWEKEVMGWDKVNTITDAGTYTLKAAEACRIDGADGEYVILQNIPVDNSGWYYGLNSLNRYKTGNRDLGGMIAYRVDYPSASVNLFDSPNNTKGSPALTIIPADGILCSSYTTADDVYMLSHCNDLYPYYDINSTTGEKTLVCDSIVNAKLNRSTLDKPVYNIKFSDNVVTFDFLKNTATAISGVTVVSHDADSRIFSVDGRYMGNDASQLPKGLYIQGGRKFVVR